MSIHQPEGEPSAIKWPDIWPKSKRRVTLLMKKLRRYVGRDSLTAEKENVEPNRQLEQVTQEMHV